MNTSSQELLKAEILAAPKRVKYACAVAWSLGIIIALRVLLVGSMPLKKSLGFAAVMLFNFIFSGMSVLGRRSRISFVLLMIWATLPLPASFGNSLHLLVLPITGEWQNDLRNFSIGLFSLAQLTLIIYLFRNLFSREALAYVWKQTPALEPATSQLQTDC